MELANDLSSLTLQEYHKLIGYLAISSLHPKLFQRKRVSFNVLPSSQTKRKLLLDDDITSKMMCPNEIILQLMRNKTN